MINNRIIIVNEHDEIIDHQLYFDTDFTKVIYRISHLWVTDCAGNILLQQRSFQMRMHPGKWTFAASGTNDEHETYESNIIKESEEEIGLILHPPVECFQKRLEQFYDRKAFVAYFHHVCDTEKPAMMFDTKEVADLKWFSPEELQEALDRDPDAFTDRVPEMLNLLHS